jgi:hypothetical protein
MDLRRLRVMTWPTEYQDSNTARCLPVVVRDLTVCSTQEHELAGRVLHASRREVATFAFCASVARTCLLAPNHD